MGTTNQRSIQTSAAITRATLSGLMGVLVCSVRKDAVHWAARSVGIMLSSHQQIRIAVIAKVKRSSFFGEMRQLPVRIQCHVPAWRKSAAAISVAPSRTVAAIWDALASRMPSQT